MRSVLNRACADLKPECVDAILGQDWILKDPSFMLVLGDADEQGDTLLSLTLHASLSPLNDDEEPMLSAAAEKKKKGSVHIARVV